VLIIGDTDDMVKRAEHAINRIIYADEDTRNKIRKEQLKVAQELNPASMYSGQIDESLLTPYGPPSPYVHNYSCKAVVRLNIGLHHSGAERLCWTDYWKRRRDYSTTSTGVWSENSSGQERSDRN
jgi:hypothetical protein